MPHVYVTPIHWVLHSFFLYLVLDGGLGLLQTHIQPQESPLKFQ